MATVSRGRFQIHWSCECGDTLAFSGMDLSATRGVVVAEIQRHEALGHQNCTNDEARRIRNSQHLSNRNANRYPKRAAVLGAWARSKPGRVWHQVAQDTGGQRTVCGRVVGDTWGRLEGQEDEPPYRCDPCRERAAEPDQEGA